jgi:predicted DNA-binding ribbon-helix-helix protein
MKRPKWTDSIAIKPGYTLADCQTTSVALQMAAKALRIEAKFWRRQKNLDAAWAVEKVAGYLDEVAAGKTWAEAFDWPAVDAGKD